MMPLVTKLPHLAIIAVGMIDSADVAMALANPHARPCGGNARVDRLPPVAMSTVPMKASATPIVSRLRGMRWLMMHTQASTTSKFRLCRMVAVPELVQLMDCKYETCPTSTQHSASARYLG